MVCYLQWQTVENEKLLTQTARVTLMEGLQQCCFFYKIFEDRHGNITISGRTGILQNRYINHRYSSITYLTVIKAS